MLAAHGIHVFDRRFLKKREDDADGQQLRLSVENSILNISEYLPPSEVLCCMLEPLRLLNLQYNEASIKLLLQTLAHNKAGT